MKKNDVLTLDIESITNLGFGVARIDGQVIFVSDTVPGDVCEVKIIKLAPSYAVGRVERLIKKSNLRTVRCELSACHSCAFKNISYEKELEIKHDDVVTAFKKCGIYDARVLPTLPSPKFTAYRNKAQYPISKSKDGEYTVGFYAPKSHRVTEARACPLAPKIFESIIDKLVAFFKKYDISVYNEEDGKGLLRHVYLRRGEVSCEVLLTLVINGNTLPHQDELVKTLTSAFPDIVGVLLNINCENTNVILGDEYITLFGRDYIYDTLAGVPLKISAPAFYQVNHDCAELLYAKAKELAMPTKDDLILDLYCGAGSIGLSMAKDARELIGIEIIESAVLCARENAKKAGIGNAHFFTGDAKDTEKLLDNAEAVLGRKIKPDIVILDPPRAGCDKTLINYVSALAPKRIVYISCNPQTLARDAALFLELGYSMGDVLPVDMFPMTGHVETIVCLRKQ